MSEKSFDRVLVVSIVMLLVCFVLLATGAFAQTSGVLMHPRWVADSPTPGTWIKTWTQSSDTTGQETIKGVWAIECVAATETKFTAYWYRRGPGVDKNKWAVYGVALDDTTYTVPAGYSATFTFSKPWVQFIIIKSGDADFSGE